MKEIIIDTETTGLDPKKGHRIVEIAALEMKNKFLTGNVFHFYVNPEMEMPDEAYKIHGISGEFLKDKKKFSDIADLFLEFISDANLVMHNAAFDINFLNHELSLIKKPLIDNNSRLVDTLVLARKLFPGNKVNLDALCRRFKIDNSERRLHSALKDAQLLSKIYIELLGGRQSSLSFDSKKKINNCNESNFYLNSNKKEGYQNCVIIKPNSDEIMKHKNFLYTLKKDK